MGRGFVATRVAVRTGNGIGAAGAEHLAGALRENKTVKVIDAAAAAGNPRSYDTDKQGEFNKPPPLVRQESTITCRLLDKVPLSEDNWWEIFGFLLLGDFFSSTTACLALESYGRTFLEQNTTLLLRFAPDYRMVGLASLGGGGRFGSVMYVDLGTVGTLGSLEPVVTALRAAEEGSTNLRKVTVRVELRQAAEVTALDEIIARCSPVLKPQATLDLSSFGVPIDLPLDTPPRSLSPCSPAFASSLSRRGVSGGIRISPFSVAAIRR